MRKEGSLPPVLSLLVVLPDVVHVGKSIKCSWANWYILLNEQRSNLVLLRTLRDCKKSEVGKKLRKLLTLESVRNKDRMDVSCIVLLTRSDVIKAIEDVQFVVHTLAPEKYRFWKSNMPRMYPHPVAITVGPCGKLLVLDYDPEKKLSKLLLLRLHNPVDVTVLVSNLVEGRSVSFSEGVAYIAERGAQRVRFVDMENVVVLKVSALRSKAQMVEHLKKRSLPIVGTLPELRKRLELHLKNISKHLKMKCVVNLETKLHKPSALCFATPGILIELSRDGITVNGKVFQETQYPPAVIAIRALTHINGNVYFAGSIDKAIDPDGDADGGIFKLDLVSLCVTKVIEVHSFCGISAYGNNLIFNDQNQVKMFNPVDGVESVVAGSGRCGNEDGPADYASFTQLQGICSESNTMYITDSATGCIKMITRLSGTAEFLKQLGRLYDSFEIHARVASARQSTTISISDATSSVAEVAAFMEESVKKVKVNHDLANKSTNGPEGTISNQTQESIKLLVEGMEALNRIFKDFPNYELDISTLLSTVVENLHAVSHFKSDTFSYLKYAMDFGSIVKESLKRTTNWSAKYFTHPRSYYPVPVNHMKLSDAVYMTPLPSITMSQEDQQLMRDWLEPYRPVRQRTVRSETTKDKAGALPPNVYVNASTAFQTVDFDTDADCGMSVEADLADIRSGLQETESMQANEQCEEVNPEDRPTRDTTAIPPTTSTQVAQMPGEAKQKSTKQKSMGRVLIQMNLHLFVFSQEEPLDQDEHYEQQLD
ncbi:Hypothetical predicted protein [Paramuricea clavata]|uniref:Uncharacterized protein n=1 Tax=Paramuricea clavata TaxID=317549 RepID=A0A6S7IF57_PARCT|nr:Hypothetical predicted protein [Paramuricea clavata]